MTGRAYRFNRFMTHIHKRDQTSTNRIYLVESLPMQTIGSYGSMGSISVKIESVDRPVGIRWS